MRVEHAPIVRMVQQRHSSDCGTACLSMLLGVSYEDALLAFGTDRALRRGVWMTELIRAAAKLGVRLKKKAQWDHDADEGIAHVRFTEGPHHVVLIRAGLLWDTDGSAWEVSDYATAKDVSFGPLLVRAE